jgi:hypothetical protein
MKPLVLLVIAAAAFVRFLLPVFRRAGAPPQPHLPGSPDDIRATSDRGSVLGFVIITVGIFLTLLTHLAEAGPMIRRGSILVLVAGGVLTVVSSFRRKLAELESADHDSPPPD